MSCLAMGLAKDHTILKQFRGYVHQEIPSLKFSANVGDRNIFEIVHKLAI